MRLMTTIGTNGLRNRRYRLGAGNRLPRSVSDIGPVPHRAPQPLEGQQPQAEYTTASEPMRTNPALRSRQIVTRTTLPSVLRSFTRRGGRSAICRRRRIARQPGYLGDRLPHLVKTAACRNGRRSKRRRKGEPDARRTQLSAGERVLSGKHRQPRAYPRIALSVDCTQQPLFATRPPVVPQHRTQPRIAG